MSGTIFGVGYHLAVWYHLSVGYHWLLCTIWVLGTIWLSGTIWVSVTTRMLAFEEVKVHDFCHVIHTAAVVMHSVLWINVHVKVYLVLVVC